MMAVPPPIRVACIGDSLTLGDMNTYPSQDCGMNRECRGVYPAVLGRLLGAGYHVSLFAIDGGTAHDSWLPPVCASITDRDDAQDMDDCLAVLHNTTVHRNRRLEHVYQKTRSIIEFNPQIAVIQLGTNDASHYLVEQVGEAAALGIAQTRHRDALVRLALVVNAPLVILLEPPRVATEAPVGRCNFGFESVKMGMEVMNPHPITAACGRSCPGYHTCRYNPRAQYCWRMNTCVDCGPPPRINTSDDKMALHQYKGCLRTDLLHSIRAGVRDAAMELEHRGADHSWPNQRGPSQCSGRRAIHAGRAPVPAAWTVYYADPIHIRPVGTAMIACHVHKMLTRMCPEHAGAIVPSGEPFCQLVMDNATKTITAGAAFIPWGLRAELALAERRLFGLLRPGF